MESRRNWWISLKASSIKSIWAKNVRWLCNEKGSQAIEFIGVLPLFLLMIIIVWQFTLTAATAITAKQAAMEGARAAMVEDVRGTNYENAVRKAASGFKISKITKDETSDGYVKVSVTLNAPLLTNAKLFDTTGLELPVSAEATVRKEKKE